MNKLYKPIERIKFINKRDFLKYYYKFKIPLVIENLIEDWPAYKKWNFSYIKNIAGNKIVPLYDSSPIDYSRKVNEPILKMRMSKYIDILQNEPTDLRIFLYNLIKYVPDLKNDFKFPKIGIRLIKEFPTLFFGGKKSVVFMHYDIDLANILHFHFHGKKQCILFSPSDTKYMYKIPYSVICHEDINFENIDFKKWPALKYTNGYITEISHGETLYIPEGWWHRMKYITPGFSMSLRSLPKSINYLGKSLYNIFIMRNIDNFMRKCFGNKWMNYKNKKSINYTNKIINIK